jgi:transcriptional regulator with XRE-family HTH domain
MRNTKKKRLEAKGWKVGSAKEFLGLSPEEEAYIEIKLKLAEGLRNQRLRRQMTQSDLARKLKSSQSRAAKMEAGEGSGGLTRPGYVMHDASHENFFSKRPPLFFSAHRKMAAGRRERRGYISRQETCQIDTGEPEGSGSIGTAGF